MGTFAAGHMLDPATGRPVAGQVVRVARFADDVPLTTVTTGALGGYARFEVEGEDAVSLIGPGDERVDLVSVERQGDSLLRGDLPAGADVGEYVVPGMYQLRPPYPGTWTGLPDGAGADGGAGILVVARAAAYESAAPIVAQEFIQYGATPRRWWRTRRTSTTWNAWTEIVTTPDYVVGNLTTTDLDTVTTPGVYQLAPPYPTGYTNVPPGSSSVGVLVVHRGVRTTSTNPIIAQEIFQHGSSPARWWRTRVGSTGWNPWLQLGSAAGGGLTVPASHTLRVRAFEDAYPLVSTGGKGVVVFRYDHGLNNFRDIILPLHQARGIPAYVAMNSRTWSDPQNSAVTQAEAAGWITSGLVEFGNHGADHLDYDKPADLYDQIAVGRAELEAQLGTTIHGFTIPGVGGTAYGGLGAGTLDTYSSTTAGALILAHHGLVSGAIGPVHRVLDGVVRQGGKHYTWEQRTFAEIKAQIDAAISTKTALTLFVHPKQINATGYYTTALLTQVLDYVAARVADGGLANLSYYQSHHATTDPLVTAAEMAAARDMARDTGWRSITPDAGVTGRILVRRVGDRVSIRLESVLPPAGTGSVFLAALPVGFRHVGEHYFLADGRSAALPSQIGLYNGSRVAWMQSMAGTVDRPTDAISGEYTWWATDAFPATPYPGTAATPA